MECEHGERGDARGCANMVWDSTPRPLIDITTTADEIACVSRDAIDESGQITRSRMTSFRDRLALRLEQ
jgi:hypothetical protein